mgnify:CR=1 FL=1
MAGESVYVIQESTLIAIADAIRSKSGSTEEIQVSNMADEIMNLSVANNPALSLSKQRITLALNFFNLLNKLSFIFSPHIYIT